jgi:serine/threonine protein kinase
MPLPAAAWPNSIVFTWPRPLVPDAIGRPYFVMEYVAGMPITTYCDRRKLSTRQRLELFISVCEGVRHAHQKAIIHRDLKPSTSSTI